MLIDACDVDEADVDDVFGSSSLEKTVRRSFRENTVFNFLSHAVCFDSLGTVCVDGRECQMAGYM